MRFLLFLLSCCLSLAAVGQEANIERDPSGRVVSSSHDVFDSRDRLSVRITYQYDSCGVVETRTLTSFDAQGRTLRQEVYTPDEYLIFVSERRYTRDGRVKMVRTTDFDDNGNATTNTFRYRYSGQKVRVYLNGKLAPSDE